MSRTIKVYLGAALRQIGMLRFDIQGARQSAAFSATMRNTAMLRAATA